MARKTRIVLIDDINGELGDETIKFGLDGIDYEIDLSSENAAKLREVLDPWIQAGLPLLIPAGFPMPPRSGLGRGNKICRYQKRDASLRKYAPPTTVRT